MAASKTKTPALGPDHFGYDLSTTAGFLAAFDDQVARFVARKGWCGQATQLAYQWSGIPAPAERGKGHPLAGLDPKWFVLSDEGRAELQKIHEAEQARLPEYKAGAERAIIRGLNEGRSHYSRTVTRQDANLLCDALGLERLVAVRSYSGRITLSNNAYFRTPAPVSPEQATAADAAVSEAISAALQTVLPGVIMNEQAMVHLYADGTSTSTWGKAGDGDPDPNVTDDDVA